MEQRTCPGSGDVTGDKGCVRDGAESHPWFRCPAGGSFEPPTGWVSGEDGGENRTECLLRGTTRVERDGVANRRLDRLRGPAEVCAGFAGVHVAHAARAFERGGGGTGFDADEPGERLDDPDARCHHDGRDMPERRPGAALASG